MPRPGAQIEDETIVAIEQPAQRRDMRGGEIHDVDVVAQGGSVGSGEVGAEDRQRRPPAETGAEHDRHEVALRPAAVAGFAVGVGASGIEISQCGPAQPVSGAI